MADYINKVIVNGEVKVDLTTDDITVDKLAKGIKAHDKTGAPIIGTNTFDSDTSTDTATAAEVLLGKTAHAKGAPVTGTMPNNGAVALNIVSKASVIVPAGYHDGSGTAKISDTEAAKLIPANIREGITVLGIVGEMSGSEGMKPQTKSVTPTFSEQEILPDEPNNCLSSVTVAAIPVSVVENEYGGNTLTIGG